jgi:hypothetical protein
MKDEDDIIAKLDDTDIARVEALAEVCGIPREEMFRTVVLSELDVIESGRSGVQGPGEKGGT